MHHPGVHLPGGAARHQAGGGADDQAAGARPLPPPPLPPQPRRGRGHPRRLGPRRHPAAGVRQVRHRQEQQQHPCLGVVVLIAVSLHVSYLVYLELDKDIFTEFKCEFKC